MSNNLPNAIFRSKRGRKSGGESFFSVAPYNSGTVTYAEMADIIKSGAEPVFERSPRTDQQILMSIIMAEENKKTPQGKDFLNRVIRAGGFSKYASTLEVRL